MRAVKVLLVSLNESARAWMRSALGPPWEFCEASHGLEALDVASDEEPDLVIADESTEPYGAFGLARELKTMTPPPRVIVLLDRAQDSWLARWSGADAWLVQPVDVFALAEAARTPQPAV